jgi:hypothetical protein
VSYQRKVGDEFFPVVLAKLVGDRKVLYWEMKGIKKGERNETKPETRRARVANKGLKGMMKYRMKRMTL